MYAQCACSHCFTYLYVFALSNLLLKPTFHEPAQPHGSTSPPAACRHTIPVVSGAHGGRRGLTLQKGQPSGRPCGVTPRCANTEKEEFDLHTLEQRSPFDESGGSINNKLEKMAATLWTSDLKPLIAMERSKLAELGLLSKTIQLKTAAPPSSYTARGLTKNVDPTAACQEGRCKAPGEKGVASTSQGYLSPTLLYVCRDVWGVQLTVTPPSTLIRALHAS